MCKSLMTLHILELIQKSLHEVVKRSDKINTPDDFLLSESGYKKLEKKYNDLLDRLTLANAQTYAYSKSQKGIDKKK